MAVNSGKQDDHNGNDHQNNPGAFGELGSGKYQHDDGRGDRADAVDRHFHFPFGIKA